MITNQIIPPYILRLYIWQLLNEAEVLKLVNGKVPLVPLEDEPEISDSGDPYIIYGYAENESVRIEQIRRGTFAARVIAPNTNQLDRIVSILSRAFESSDIATEAVNRFSTNFGEQLHGIRFTHVKTSATEGFNAATTEEGPVEGVVIIDYHYINHLPIPVPQDLGEGLWV